MKPKLISFVVPVFNEEETIPIFINEVKKLFEESTQNYGYEIVFINDGSSDQTQNILNQSFQVEPGLILIEFSRNFGKENALFAGLEEAKGDIIIPIDVDLQDPLNVIPLMLEKYEQGYKMVLAKRTDRSSDGFLKRKTAELFYRFYNKISKVKLEPNVGDFRLMDKEIVNNIIQLSENQLFMKGIFGWIGYDYAVVEYTREKRTAGSTKFNAYKLMNLAIEGITSFSTIPIRIWTYLGGFVALISFLMGLKVIIEKIFLGIPVSGYASLFVAIIFLGGVQLIGIGVLGEYIGRIYMETKKRPKYIIKEKKRHES